tara:strand:+ start:7395 stop:8087 length:693 start_codon:yes stop_codon:yes gene_type:complete
MSSRERQLFLKVSLVKIFKAARNPSFMNIDQTVETIQEAMMLAGIAKEAGKLEVAIKLANEVLDSDNSLSNVHGFLGDCYFDTGQYGPAIDRYTDALQRGARKEMVLTNLGRCYIMGEMWHRAEETFEKALREDYSNIYAHTGMGKALVKRGKFLGAKLHFTEALSQINDQELPSDHPSRKEIESERQNAFQELNSVAHGEDNFLGNIYWDVRARIHEWRCRWRNYRNKQ